MSEATSIPAPACPACAKSMQLARVTPAVAGHPALHSYECTECGEVLTTEVDPDAET